MQIRFFTYSQFHGKNPDVGSTHIRVNQLLKYWPGADKYKYGENPDVLIFQKVYCAPDYRFPINFKGVKILDVCDPSWLEGLIAVKETVDAVDAVTCSTDKLSEFFRQLTDKPVLTVPDRFDIALIPAPREHKDQARTAVWFGYRHNAECLKYAMPILNELGINLIVVSNDDPIAWQWLPRIVGEEYRAKHYEFIKYNEDTIYKVLQNADFAILPDGTRPVDVFKSNNRAVKSILAGLPVAKTSDEVRSLIDPANRRKFMADHYEDYKKEYDVRRSVDQYLGLIDDIVASKTN